MKITKDTKIEEILEAYPETRAVFSELGMGCLDCMGASMETVEVGACMHNLDLRRVLAALEQAVSARGAAAGPKQDSEQE